MKDLTRWILLLFAILCTVCSFKPADAQAASTGWVFGPLIGNMSYPQCTPHASYWCIIYPSYQASPYDHQLSSCAGNDSTGVVTAHFVKRDFIDGVVGGVVDADEQASASMTVCTLATCTSPQVIQADGTCANPPSSCTAGQTAGGQYDGSGSAPSTICINGCSYGGGFTISSTNGGEASWSRFGPMTNTGSSCSTNATPSTTNAPPAPCGLGTCPGVVNGVSVCTACNNSTQKSTTNKQNTDPGNGTDPTTAVEVTKEQKVNSDGSVTTTTTTTTTKTPAGGGTPTTTTKVDEKVQDKKSFCDENPTLTICRGSSFGGSCNSTACDGDAIQCAIAQEQYKRDCALFDMPTALSNLGNAVASGSDPDAATLPQHSSQLNTISAGTLSTSTFLTGGSALVDQTVALGDKSFVIPWSKWNVVLGYMGLIVMAFAAVASYKIIGVH